MYTPVKTLTIQTLGTKTLGGVARSKNEGWTHMANAELEPITKFWGGVNIEV